MRFAPLAFGEGRHPWRWERATFREPLERFETSRKADPSYGGMAEWFKAAVLKTAERKLRGFESYSLRQQYLGEVAEWSKAAAC